MSILVLPGFRSAETFSFVTEYRISRRVSEQFEAFMSGFNELIPQELINVFDERELEVCFYVQPLSLLMREASHWRNVRDRRG